MPSTPPAARDDRAGSMIETRSIDYVPDDERHGKVTHQGPFWFVGNFQPFTLALGFVGPSLGLSLGGRSSRASRASPSARSFMAFHATQGPVLGLPQMIQSRAQFGYRGVLLPLIGTLFTFVGFNVVDVVIIKSGLQSIFGWNPVLVAIVITVVAALVAIFGHDLLHKSFRVLFWISLPLWIVLTCGVLFGGVDRNRLRHRRFHVRRLPGAVQRGGVLQHHLRAVRLGLQPLPAAQHQAVRHHRVGVPRRLGVARLADPARRVDGHLPRRE